VFWRVSKPMRDIDVPSNFRKTGTYKEGLCLIGKIGPGLCSIPYQAGPNP